MNTLLDLGYWYGSNRGDVRAIDLFMRHYTAPPIRPTNRSIGAPGEIMVLLTSRADALFIWTKQQYRADGQQGVNCAVFRNESDIRSSDLIREAMQLAWQRWPDERLFTFVNPAKIKSANPGYCFKMAGWISCGMTKERGLVILEACHWIPVTGKPLRDTRQLGGTR